MLQSDHVHMSTYGITQILDSVTLLLAKLASLSDMSSSSAHIGEVLSACPCISTLGVNGVGFPFESNQTTCVVAPVK